MGVRAHVRCTMLAGRGNFFGCGLNLEIILSLLGSEFIQILLFVLVAGS
jgi:hypothetical protein